MEKLPEEGVFWRLGVSSPGSALLTSNHFGSWQPFGGLPRETLLPQKKVKRVEGKGRESRGELRVGEEGPRGGNLAGMSLCAGHILEPRGKG